MMLGDQTGAVLGALFFVVFSVLLELPGAATLVRLLSMDALNNSGRRGRGIAVVLGIAIGIGTFTVFYVSTLAGFGWNRSPR